MKYALRIAAAVAVLALGFQLLWSPEQPAAPTGLGAESQAESRQAASQPSDSTETAAPAPTPAATRVAQQPHANETGQAAEAEHAHAEHGATASLPSEARALTTWLNENPVSTAPHEVIRAWGGQPGSAGPIGLNIVVDPNLSTRELEQLVRDIRGEYGSADVLSGHIYDSQEAATYDQHADGGALAAAHLVARVVRDAAMKIDSIQIRGQQLEASD